MKYFFWRLDLAYRFYDRFWWTTLRSAWYLSGLHHEEFEEGQSTKDFFFWY